MIIWYVQFANYHLKLTTYVLKKMFLQFIAFFDFALFVQQKFSTLKTKIKQKYLPR